MVTDSSKDGEESISKQSVLNLRQLKFGMVEEINLLKRQVRDELTAQKKLGATRNEEYTKNEKMEFYKVLLNLFEWLKNKIN